MFAVAITVDNEASYLHTFNAGLTHAIASVPEARHLMHFRCGAHNRTYDAEREFQYAMDRTVFEGRDGPGEFHSQHQVFEESPQ